MLFCAFQTEKGLWLLIIKYFKSSRASAAVYRNDWLTLTSSCFFTIQSVLTNQGLMLRKGNRISKHYFKGKIECSSLVFAIGVMIKACLKKNRRNIYISDCTWQPSLFVPKGIYPNPCVANWQQILRAVWFWS